MQFSMLPLSGQQVQQEIVVNRIPDGLEIGPIMKCKYFRIQAVTNQNVLFNLRPELVRGQSSCAGYVRFPRGTTAICDCLGNVSRQCSNGRSGITAQSMEPASQEPQSGRRDLPRD